MCARVVCVHVRSFHPMKQGGSFLQAEQINTELTSERRRCPCGLRLFPSGVTVDLQREVLIHRQMQSSFSEFSLLNQADVHQETRQ